MDNIVEFDVRIHPIFKKLVDSNFDSSDWTISEKIYENNSFQLWKCQDAPEQQGVIYLKWK